MVMRDLASHLQGVATLDPQLLCASVSDAAAIDIQGFDSVTIFGIIGAEGAGTLDADNRWDFVLQGAADDGAGSPDTWADITDADNLIGSFVDAANGVIFRVDAAGEAPGLLKVGVNVAADATIRFLRVNADAVGSPANLQASVLAVQGHAHMVPTE